MLVILFVLAASFGATMAWFTDEAETTNAFTAGTLIIDAEDDWSNYSGEDWENANPGDCEPKDFKITNQGSKNMYVRFSFVGSWENVNDFPDPHDLDLTGFNPDDSLVTIEPVAGDLDDWTYLDGYWYYNGILPPEDPDTTADDHVLEFTFLVCLDGPDTGNEYQGASYNIEFTFQAIQATHTASFDIWSAGYYNDDQWYEVLETAGDYEMTGNAAAGTWTPTGSGVPNYEGWTYY